MTKVQSARAKRRAARQRNLRIIAIVVGLFILAVAAFAIYSVIQERETSGNMITTASGLQYEDLVVGSGQEARAGDTVSVHYTGLLADGSKFDSSLDRGVPFEFTIGARMVIPGWDEGLQGMKVGGKRKLVIPSNLAYGAAGIPGVIPQNATLTFEVELVAIK